MVTSPVNLSSISFELHRGCSNTGDCKRCLCSLNGGISPEDLPLSLLEKVLVELTPEYKTRISISGTGEPLESHFLLESVALIRSLCPRAYITLDTNGHLLTLALSRRLFEAGLSVIVVSCHNPDILGTAIYLRRILNEGHWGLLTFFDYSKGIPSTVLDNRAGLYPLANDHFSTPCSIPKDNIYINVKGSVVPCFRNQYNTLSLGDLYKISLEHVLKSEAYLKFNERLIMGRNQYPCQFCDYDPYLNPPPGIYYPFSSDPLEPPPEEPET